eukprot:4235752-Alexandrium_andersonii.AAC.1
MAKEGNRARNRTLVGQHVHALGSLCNLTVAGLGHNTRVSARHLEWPHIESNRGNARASGRTNKHMWRLADRSNNDTSRNLRKHTYRNTKPQIC